MTKFEVAEYFVGGLVTLALIGLVIGCLLSSDSVARRRTRREGVERVVVEGKDCAILRDSSERPVSVCPELPPGDEGR